jgi:alanine racemase
VRLGALARNYAKLRDIAHDAVVGAVVKADAYGLGAQRVARRLFEEGCRQFFVATLEEGTALRGMLPVNTGAEIYVFEGLRAASENEFSRHALSPVLNTRAQVQRWASVGAACAVHVDTGMSRLGLSVEEAADLFAESTLANRIGLQCLMTHLACADQPDDPMNRLQLERFESLRAMVGDVMVSICNSAGAFLDARFHGDLIRAGIALYGGNPFSNQGNPMEPVASLFARILQLRRLEHEASVGYGATYTAPAGSRIATVGVGYADGYPRMLGNSAHAVWKSHRFPVVGRVSMDLTCVDVSDSAGDMIAVGDYVEMLGEHISLDEIAGLCSTISYEILTGLKPRVPRVYVD